MTNKILVVSDNHGNMSNLKYILEEFQGEFDLLVHCGDSEFPCQTIRSLVDCPVHMAEGNCDYCFEEDSDDIFEFCNHVCFVTHGHKYGVNWGEDELLEKAMEMGADIVFYGHTHCPAYRICKEEGVTILNPGSISLPRQNPPNPTFLIVEFEENGTITPRFYTF